jgi:hypothetical protein
LDLVIGRKLLFKVEKSPRMGSILFDGSFRVKRICTDLSIIEAFDSVSYSYYFNFVFEYFSCWLFTLFFSFVLGIFE